MNTRQWPDVFNSVDKFLVSIDSTFSANKVNLSFKLKATQQPLSDEKVIKETATRILGFADRLALPQRILDFCGSFPIYEVEEVPVEALNASMRGTLKQTLHIIMTQTLKWPSPLPPANFLKKFKDTALWENAPP